jgi:tryptophanyl-tRNA synthetase
MARILSGIQPTGDIHLGNYIGALRHWAASQDEHDGFYCLVDLHAITQSIPDPEVLRSKTLEAGASLMAAGIDPARSTLFVQSHVHQHAELAWILNCFTMFGELRRMTQFKDKSAKQDAGSISAGLFNYPVLQAADILIYQAERVPVGEDQRQHLEVTRDIAQRFNQRYGDTFVLPEAAIPPVGAKIMDLQYPEQKMSKSADSPQGTLLVIDPPDVIRKKVKVAVTDSGRDILVAPDKPAISNLITIMSVATGRSIAQVETAYAGTGYGQFKADLGEALVEFLRPVQDRFVQLVADPAGIAEMLERGAEKAQAVAAKTLDAVYERVGFLPRAGR